MNKTIETKEQEVVKIDPIKNIEQEQCKDKLDFFNHLSFNNFHIKSESFLDQSNHIYFIIYIIIYFTTDNT